MLRMNTLPAPGSPRGLFLPFFSGAIDFKGLKSTAKGPSFQQSDGSSIQGGPPR